MKELSEKQKEKRENIFQAATELFSFKGFNDTKVSEIAQKAGVSFGTIFTYFETKEALFKAVIVEPLTEFKKIFTKYENVEYWHIDGVHSMVKEHIDYFAHKRMYLQLIQQVLGQTERFPDLFRTLDQAADDIRNSLTPLIKIGQMKGWLTPSDSDIITRSYLSFLIGIRLTQTDEPNHPVWKQFEPILLSILGYKKGNHRGL